MRKNNGEVQSDIAAYVSGADGAFSGRNTAVSDVCIKCRRKKTSESTISAQDAAANETEELYGGISSKSENEAAEIIGEDTSRREENVKHFVQRAEQRGYT